MSGTGNIARGFTLVEVMITVTILAVGMVGIMRAYAAMINTLEVADYSIETVCLLKEKMFEAERKAIEEGNPPPGVERGEAEGEYGKYTWDSAVTEVDSSLEYDEKTGACNLIKGDLVMYLNEAKVTVSNEDVTPVRRFTLVSYVDGWGYYEPEK